MNEPFILTINDVELTQFHLHYLICLYLFGPSVDSSLPAVIEPFTFNAVRPISINGSIEISSATKVTGKPIAGSTISAAKVAPTNTSHTN